MYLVPTQCGRNFGKSDFSPLPLASHSLTAAAAEMWVLRRSSSLLSTRPRHGGFAASAHATAFHYVDVCTREPSFRGEAGFALVRLRRVDTACWVLLAFPCATALALQPPTYSPLSPALIAPTIMFRVQLYAVSNLLLSPPYSALTLDLRPCVALSMSCAPLHTAALDPDLCTCAIALAHIIGLAYCPRPPSPCSCPSPSPP